MVRQSLTMQQNFNADELAEEKELFSDDRLEDNVIYDWQSDRDWYDYEADQESLNDSITNDLSDFTGGNDNDITDNN